MSTSNSVTRKPHYWKICNDGSRELLSSKRWTFCGGYASKVIGGETVILRTHEEEADHRVVIIERKKDFWQRITSNYRYKVNRWERARKRRAWHAYNWLGQHTTAPTKRDLMKNLYRYIQQQRRYELPPIIEDKICAGHYRLIIDDQPWFIFRRQSDAEQAGFSLENYKAFNLLDTDPYAPKRSQQQHEDSVHPIPLWFQGETGRKRQQSLREEYPTLDYMLDHGMPLDRETYLSLEWFDKDKALDWEQELELPPEFRKEPSPEGPSRSNPSELTWTDMLREDMPYLSDEEIQEILSET